MNDLDRRINEDIIVLIHNKNIEFAHQILKNPRPIDYNFLLVAYKDHIQKLWSEYVMLN